MQDNNEVKKKQIECLPMFIGVADVICALKSGDEEFYSRNNQPQDGALDSSNKDPGHYNNRVWTSAELFVATSDFVSQFAGQKPAVYTTELDHEMKPVTEVGVEESADLRSRLHESYTWSLPPRENLAYTEDLVTLEPLLIIMGQSSIPRVAAAAMVGAHSQIPSIVHPFVCSISVYPPLPSPPLPPPPPPPYSLFISFFLLPPKHTLNTS
jgi:hypothetical protein